MNELAFDTLMRLARTTALLSVAVAVLMVVVRFGCLRSARWRRGLAVLALMQGVLWVQLPLAVPWHEPVYQTDEDREPVHPEPLGIVGNSDAPVLPIAAPAAEPIRNAAPAPVILARRRNESAPAWRMSWPLLMCGIWILGIAAFVAVSLLRYVAFVRHLPPAHPMAADWLNEFEEVRSTMNVVGRLKFQLTDASGPLLCWTPRGSLLLVPDALWRELTGTQRRAVLRHELAHFKRNDLVKSLLIRVLAIPHWFNPLAWWAVREFDEAAEWICDDLAATNAETEYARALVRLCEPPPLAMWPTTAARGSGVARRVRRLLETQTKEDSIMKKLILAAGAVAILVAGLVRVELVAQAPLDADTNAEISVVLNSKRAEKQKAMINAARRTYEAFDELFKAGTTTYEPLYVWSSKIRSSELRAADSRQQVTQASQEHLHRMRKLHDKVAALGRQGAKGGEAEKFAATQFYVAEAELLLLEATSNEQIEFTPELPR
ncbi:MAG: M56 family metallopeptidase [Pirellulales bacterium]